jgi:hypothetical protein
MTKMDRLEKFIENKELNESLQTPLEFFMTDDTKMPREIYSAFELDGIQYGMSLVETKYNKVYSLEFYRIVNVKKRFWSFYKTTHVRPILSTIIRFFEACHPFVHHRMHGIIIELPTKKGSERYVTFLDRVLKKSYIKQYRSLPVLKKTDKANNYMFLIRKGISPETLFKTAAFHKHFEFDPEVKDDSIVSMTDVSTELLDVAKEPYKFIKPTASVKPSEKFAFKKLKVEIEADAETVAILDAASDNYAKFGNPEKEKVLTPEEQKKLENAKYKIKIVYDVAKNAMGDFIPPNTNSKKLNDFVMNQGGYYIGALPESMLQSSYDSNKTKIITISLDYIFALMLPEVRKLFKNKTSYTTFFKDGYVKDSLSLKSNYLWSLNYKFSDAMGSASFGSKIARALAAAKVIYSETDLGLTVYSEGFFSKMLKRQYLISEEMVQKFGDFFNIKITEMGYDIKKDSDFNVEVTKLDLDWAPTSILPEFEDGNISKINKKEFLPFTEKDEDDFDSPKVLKKIEALHQMPEVGKWYKQAYEHDPYKGDDFSRRFKLLKDYSGSEYRDYNIPLRKMISSNSIDLAYLTTDIKELMRFFDTAPRLENGIWVYRNCSIPGQEKFEPGQDIIDPAFLSTTIRSTMRFGSNDCRLKIYLPKGTRILPVLSFSENFTENEIVLPPMSVLRILEVYKGLKGTYNKEHRAFVCTMIGSAYKSIMENVDSNRTLIKMNEDNEKVAPIKNKSKDSTDDKWSSFGSQKVSAQISELIKKGKLKINQ